MGNWGHTHIHTHSRSDTRSLCPLSDTHTLSISFTHNPHTHSLTYSHTQTLTTHSFSYTPMHTIITYILALSDTHALKHSHSPPLSVLQTHTHTLSMTHTGKLNFTQVKITQVKNQPQTDGRLLVPGSLSGLHCENVLFTSQTVPTC